ncbi:hypothetical protein RF11_07577 [Thelohanellus kitauei]|uniref:Tc1-like transposase DDE domain-containing protein n=1 Tax=Thelohanellus kitauei TaxID=669202 RepID=A0A0C2ML08_THEKT|nr:hypothetical protein RF11_07577 [Thelohanellus kitauei]
MNKQFFPQNKITFYEFVRECMCNLPNNTNIFVTDNVQFPHSTEVYEVMESQGCQIFLISPFLPQLNPIELLFSKWKRFIKSGVSIFNGNTPLLVIFAASTQMLITDCAGCILESTCFASSSPKRKSC